MSYGLGYGYDKSSSLTLSGAGAPADSLGKFGDVYVNTSDNVVWTKLRGGRLAGSDNLLITPITADYLNPSTTSYSVVLNVMFDVLPTTSLAILSNRLAGVGSVIFFDGSVGKLVWRTSLDGLAGFDCTSQTLVVGEWYTITASWDHLAVRADLNINGTAVFDTTAGGSVTVATSNSLLTGTLASSSDFKCQYASRIRRALTVSEQEIIQNTRLFNATGSDLVFNGSLQTPPSGTSVTNYGWMDSAFTLTDGSPGTWWSEWWIPMNRMLNASVGTMTLPQIQSLPGGYLSESTSDDLVALSDPLLAGGDWTFFFACKFDAVPVLNSTVFRLATTGDYKKLLIRPTTDTSKLDMYCQHSTAVGYYNAPSPNSIQAGVPIYGGVRVTATGGSFRTSLGNSTDSTGSGNIISGTSISATECSWKPSIVVAYNTAFTDAQMDAIVAGGKLPPEVPAYIYCPAIQGAKGTTSIMTSAGVATLTDASPTTFWTN